MKSRTLCCKGTVLRKDITRFAPLWAIYLIGGLLVMLSTVSSSDASSAARSLATTIGPFSIINMIYAALCAQLLFGDLFKSRMCNALHAMPLRRESWFLTHVVSGLLFSAVPHIIAAGLMAWMLEDFWFVALLWLLGMTLEFIFFFSLAVFSVFCTGNRFAMVAVYGILNFASVIAYWFIYTIYEPMLFGVTIADEIFILLCPVVQMCGGGALVIFERVQTNYSYYQNPIYLYKGLGEGWNYLAVCAVIGVVLLVLALLMYRRRKLESAGNFIAVKPLEPVFAVVFTLCVGCVFASFGQLFDGGYLVYLIAGLTIGWFVGQMLLRRTVKVFQWKTFLKLAIFGLAMGASLLLTHMDPFGIVSWTPVPEQVAVVEVNTGKQINKNSSHYMALENPEEIQKVINAHKTIVEAGEVTKDTRSRFFTIQYTLTDGRQVSRTYMIYADTAAWNVMQGLYSTPQQILGYEDWDSFVEEVTVRIEGYSIKELCKLYNQKYGISVNAEKLCLELLEALRRDCEAGLMTNSLFETEKMTTKYCVELEQDNRWRHVAVYTVSKNTLAWMETYEYLINMSGK